MDRHSRRKRSRSLAVAAAPLLALTALAVPAAAQPHSPTPERKYVDVSVTTVWTSPSSARSVDEPALSNPVHTRQWLSRMSLDQKKNLTSDGRTQTQALYGEPVYVLQERGGWDKIAIPGQPSPKNELGYPGWVPKKQLTGNRAFAALRHARPMGVVRNEVTTGLYDDPALRHRDRELSVNTRLPVLARTARGTLVATPADGPKWLRVSAVDVSRSAKDVPTPSGTNLVRFAKQFLGKPYLWGGRSGFGPDCSGFTSTIYQAHGITIPRDADAQALDGAASKVAKPDLRRGDLLFYADKHGSGHIYHVAMYIGGGKMIEAYDSGTPVRVTKARFGSEYWGAVRYPETGR